MWISYLREALASRGRRQADSRLSASEDDSKQIANA